MLDPLLYGGHHNTISRPSQQSYKYILLLSMSPVVCGQTVRHFMAIKLIEIQSVFPLLIWPGVKISGQIRDSKDWCGVCWYGPGVGRSHSLPLWASPSAAGIICLTVAGRLFRPTINIRPGDFYHLHTRFSHGTRSLSHGILCVYFRLPGKEPH